jgi:hypothetical protein
MDFYKTLHEHNVIVRPLQLHNFTFHTLYNIKMAAVRVSEDGLRQGASEKFAIIKTVINSNTVFT